MITANWTEWVATDAWRDADLRIIPPPPRALAEVLWLAHDNDVDTRRLIRLVAEDPVFTIRVLRLANVAAYAASRDVTSVELAVVRLGTRTVRRAVLASCMTAWAQTADIYSPKGEDEVQHAVGTGLLARRIAEWLPLDGDDAFVHGLLHDVGKLFLRKLRSEYLRLGGRAPSAAEFQSVVDVAHPEVGAVALQLWGLPESVRTPVRWHHQPADAPQPGPAVAIIYAANLLSRRYGFGRPVGRAVDPAIDPVCCGLGLPPGWLQKMDAHAGPLAATAANLIH